MTWAYTPTGTPATRTTTPRLRPMRPVVTIERPRCPECGSAHLLTQRSVADQGDGSTLRLTKCRSCGCNFEVVLE